MATSRRLRTAWVLLLCLCSLALPAHATQVKPDEVALTVQTVRIDDILLHVGEIANPKPNIGIVLFTEIFDGLWLTVVSGTDEAVLPLDESGLFARVAYFVINQSKENILVPVEYVILDLDNVPKEMTHENAKAVALASFLVEPEETNYAAVMEAAPDARGLYPEIDAMLEKQMENP